MKLKHLHLGALTLLIALASSFVSAQVNPKRGWADSYSVNGKCYCATTFDHGIGGFKVQTPAGQKTVREVCNKLGKGPGKGNNPVYNTVQCGHEPGHNDKITINGKKVADEKVCPGRVDQGSKGCQTKGPKWDLSVYGGGNNGGGNNGGGNNGGGNNGGNNGGGNTGDNTCSVRRDPVCNKFNGGWCNIFGANKDNPICYCGGSGPCKTSGGGNNGGGNDGGNGGGNTGGGKTLPVKCSKAKDAACNVLRGGWCNVWNGAPKNQCRCGKRACKQSDFK